jgi:cellulose synthase (UDP-forming)
MWRDDELFAARRAAPPTAAQHVILGLLIVFGLLSVARFAWWWFRAEHVADPLLFALLSLAVWYGVARIVIGWYSYAHVAQPQHVEPADGLSVAIFITSSPGEPYEMFVRTLAAARAIRHPHTTYLLDDTRDPRFGELAREQGAVHLELVGFPGAKAGKINAALERTTEELILVLDPDHIPFPQFLDRVLGHFADDRVGFVQVAQAYYNQPQSFVARAAAEQTYAFYGPVMQGMHGTGTAVAIGANCTFRRTALASIGGHGVGLAEDLVTAIRLHSAGWKSVYVPEILARGLVPEDLGSFVKQQLKWSRGVYEVLFREYPRAFRRLTAHQKLAYLAIGTYYLVGLTTPVYLLIPALYLWTGLQPAAMFLSDYLLHALPVGVCGVAIYRFAQRWLCDPRRERGWHWRGMLLKVGCWNVYLHGLWLALLGVAVPYIPTAKSRQRGNFWRLAAVPLTITISSFVTLAAVLVRRLWFMPEAEVRITTEVAAGMIGFLMINVLLMSGRIYAAWNDRVR